MQRGAAAWAEVLHPQGFFHLFLLFSRLCFICCVFLFHLEHVKHCVDRYHVFCCGPLWFVCCPVDAGELEAWPLLQQLWDQWLSVLHPYLPQWGTQVVSSSHIICSVTLKTSYSKLCICDGVNAPSFFLCWVKIESWCPMLPGRVIPVAVEKNSEVKAKAKECKPTCYLCVCVVCIEVGCVKGIFADLLYQSSVFFSLYSNRTHPEAVRLNSSSSYIHCPLS